MEIVFESAGPHATRETLEHSVHDVHTEFVDMGIGCCWFARRGEGESVTGETEEEAIARLADHAGLELLFTARAETSGQLGRA